MTISHQTLMVSTLSNAARALTATKNAANDGNAATDDAESAALGASGSGGAKKKPRRKKKKNGDKDADISAVNTTENGSDGLETVPHDVEIEYVPAPLLGLSANTADDENGDPDSIASQFANVLARFQFTPSTDDNDTVDSSMDMSRRDSRLDGDFINGRNENDEEGDQDDEDEDMDGEQKISKRKLKKLRRLTVAELKQLVKRPEVVDWVDVTADDPKLLVTLKSVRNTVPIPVHWSQKRKYLQGKRGIEKPAFELPDYIKATGIQEMRNATAEKEEASKLKAKTRERLQPKTGKLTIDYSKLHDAFFRWQTKPKLTRFGEMYFEGKEYETKLKSVRPGAPLSEELRQALMMPPLAPPPWLINMQRFGPPPSYPGLKIPGLNAPIPPGAQWGFHPGGWGKAPVDEYGYPLYGGLLSSMYNVDYVNPYMIPAQKELWGELDDDEEEEEEEENDEDEEAENDENEEIDSESGYMQPLDEISTGMATPSGLTSVATTSAGMETPDVIELRKNVSGIEKEKTLYTVVPQKSTAITGFMGSQHVYDIKGAKKRKSGPEVSVALDPSEVEHLNEAAMKQKYDTTVLQLEKDTGQTEGGGLVTAASIASAAAVATSAKQEDLSDMVADYAVKQAKKRKTDDKKKSKQKEYKF